MDQPKLFSGFLSGVSKRIFDRDNDITIEFLKEQLFPSYNDITLEVLQKMFNECAKVLNKAAYEDWELSQLETELKQGSTFSEGQQEVFLKFWRIQKPKIHDMLNKEVTWNNSLTKMSWRVDSKAKSRKQADLNELTSIVELVLKEKGNQDSNVIRFEMDKEQLDRALNQINSIQKQLAKYSS